MIHISFICIFCIFLAAPLFTADFRGGRVSESENRVLAPFPQLTGESKTPLAELPAALESWCGDNIGFREGFRSVYNNFNYNALGSFSSDKVYKGIDGWLYQYNDDNLNIATGKHIISEETLEAIASDQQAVSDRYAADGKIYYLVLIPSKPSLYPEYIADGTLGIRETTVDILEKYLNEHTDVRVINLKDDMIAAKGGDWLLYLKTDTHWSAYGSYVGYNTIMKRFLSDGVIDKIYDFAPEFRDTMYESGDLSRLVGTGIIAPEHTSEAVWEKGYTIDTSSDEHQAVVDEISRIPLNQYNDETRYINSTENAVNRSLFIYGDSFFLDKWYTPRYFAENFSVVQYTRVRRTVPELDEAANADIVIYESCERLIEAALAG